MENQQLDKYRLFIKNGKKFNEEMQRTNISLYYIAEFVAKTKCDAAVAVAEVTKGIDCVLAATRSIFSLNTKYLRWNIDAFNQMARDVYIAQEQQVDEANPLLDRCNFGSGPNNAAYCPNKKVLETLSEALDSLETVCNDACRNVEDYILSYRQTRDCVPQNIQEEMDRFYRLLHSYFFDETVEGGVSFSAATGYVSTILEDWKLKIMEILGISPDDPVRVRTR